MITQMIHSVSQKPLWFNTAFVGGRRFLLEGDGQPGPGDYLSPQHYRYAVFSFEDRYQEKLPGNAERVGRAHITKKWLANFANHLNLLARPEWLTWKPKLL
jgi:hypothetical protein